MAQQYTDTALERVLLDMSEIYQETCNGFVDQLKEEFANTLVDALCAIQKDVKNMLHEYPQKSKNQQISLLMDTYKSDTLEIDFTNFFKQAITNVMTLEKLFAQLEENYTNIKKFITDNAQNLSKDAIEKKLIDMHKVEEMSSQEHALFTGMIMHTMNDHYGTTSDNKLKVFTGGNDQSPTEMDQKENQSIYKRLSQVPDSVNVSSPQKITSKQGNLSRNTSRTSKGPGFS